MNSSYNKTDSARNNAPGPISIVAARLGRELYHEAMTNVRAPDDEHVIVPEVTVSVTWRVEKKENT